MSVIQTESVTVWNARTRKLMLLLLLLFLLLLLSLVFSGNLKLRELLWSEPDNVTNGDTGRTKFPAKAENQRKFLMKQCKSK